MESMTNGIGIYTIIFYGVFALVALILVVMIIANIVQVIISRREESGDDQLDEIE
jgi:hypothetical protein